MARQARIEYPPSVHHVRSRGNQRHAVFLDDRDRIHFLALLAEAVRLLGWLLMAWVLMTFHLVLEADHLTIYAIGVNYYAICVFAVPSTPSSRA